MGRCKGKPFPKPVAGVLPAVNSDLVVRPAAEDKLLERFSWPANMGSLFQHFRLLAPGADGVSVDDQTSGHLRLGVVIIAEIADHRIGDVYFPNVHIYHAPFQARGFPLAFKGKRPDTFESQEWSIPLGIFSAGFS